MWLNGKRHGKGKRQNQDGSFFEGVYEYDQPIKGKYQWAEGEYYDGEWQDGHFHGKGEKVMTKVIKKFD